LASQPYCEQVGGAVESNPVVERKALAGENSVGDGPETLVGENEFAQVNTLPGKLQGSSLFYKQLKADKKNR
jgi:hypothetical protein